MIAAICKTCGDRVAMRERSICTVCFDANARAPGVGARWRVRFSNYFPAEIDSEWPTQAQADARVDELNGDGGGMWEVEEVTT